MGNLSEVLKLFFKMGVLAFGGPAAHIAMLHKEVVDKRKWVDEQHFLDLVGATALIPGPNSTEMVIHCGYQRAGIKGLFLGGMAFIFPATILTLILAYFYKEYQSVPNFENYLIGIKPIVILLIIDALKKLYKKAIKTTDLLIIGGFVFLLGFTPIGEINALFVGTIIGSIFLMKKKALFSFDPVSIFLPFLKIGSILFGSGYVLIAYVQNEFVLNRGWLTELQIVDAIGIGQFTPGPVLSTSTFIGYLLGDTTGAIAATVGIFLPSFLFVYLLTPLIPKMRNSKRFGVVLDCLNAGSLGLMAYALVPLSKATFTSVPSLVLLAIMFGIKYKFKSLGAISLVSISAILGFISTFISF